MQIIQTYALVGAVSLGTLAALHAVVWRTQRERWSAMFGMAFLLSAVVYAFDAHLQPLAGRPNPTFTLLRAPAIALLTAGMIDYVGLRGPVAGVLRALAIASILIVLGCLLAQTISRTAIFAVYTGHLCLQALLAAWAMRQEPRRGHGLVFLALLLYPASFLAVMLGWVEVALLRYVVIAPIAVLGMTVLMTGLLRAHRRADGERLRAERAEETARAANALLEQRIAELECSEAALRSTEAQLRQSKNELESQTEILQSILDSMGDGVLVANESGELLLVNPAGERIAGVVRLPGPPLRWEQRDGLYLQDLSTPCPATELPLAKAMRGESCDEMELFARASALGQGRWLSATARTLTDKRGAVRGGVVVVSDVTARKNAEQEIHTLNELRRELEFRREAAREEERTHIARELHDELGQILSALRMELSLLRMRWSASDAQLREKVQSLQTMVDHVIGMVRNLVANLRPAVLDMGIAPALEWLAAQFSVSNGVRCDLQVDEQAVQLHAQQISAVFRMVQESLTNVARHAQARQVHVILQRRQDMYVLTVRDDGRGFDPAQVAPKSFGLLGLRERAQMLGGRLDIRSNPGAGTFIAVEFPAAGVAA